MDDTQVLIPRMTLRWVKRYEWQPGLPESVQAPRMVLQQGYSDTFGRLVWKDVPEQEE